MKLKFQMSQSANKEPYTTRQSILSVLKYNGYRIQSVTDKSVVFDDDPWALQWNFKAMGRISGGTFQITQRNDSVDVTLDYYLSLTAPVIILIILSVVLICQGEYYAPFFFLSFYVIAVIINVIILKGIAADILIAIIND